MSAPTSHELSTTEQELLDWLTQLLRKIDADVPGDENLDLAVWARAWVDATFSGRTAPEVKTERQLTMLLKVVGTCLSDIRTEIEIDAETCEP